ncbi:alkaline phosphatase family protein [Pseudonocardia hispaniensis]|uniref:Alkaline phosphatase family protein n=1 Tax=Pseudonocardia hispaniensis TaxID=904933 RepID=A0ABW1J031_9PSEU
MRRADGFAMAPQRAGRALTAFLVVLAVAVTGCATTREPPAPARVPTPDHVVVVVFENKDADQILGNPDAPYLTALARQGADFTDAHAETHPSQPNYLALFSGDTQGVADDSCTGPFPTPNLASQLVEAGRTFTGYAEDLPAVGYTGCEDGDYVRKHNPWVNFSNVPAEANRPLSDLPADYADLPTVSFLIPNLCHDMHDCDVATGDGWAREHLDGYLRWAHDHNSLLVVTFDEAESPGGDNRIVTVFAGPMVAPGQYAERVDHYRLLRTLQAMYGLAPLGHSADTDPITDVWTGDTR